MARKISRLAVGDPTLRPVTDSFSVNKYLLQDDRAGEDLPFGSRGGLAVRYYFPVDGDYFVKIYLLRTYDGRIRGLVEHAGDGGNQSKGDEQVANQQPPSSNESVHDDQERKRERDNNDRAPDPRGPTEQCGDRPSDLCVGLGSRPRDHRFEPGESGCGRHKHAVDRPAIPSARLGRNEQREVPGTRFRASLSTTGVGDRLHSVCWLGKPMPHL